MISKHVELHAEIDKLTEEIQWATAIIQETTQDLEVKQSAIFATAAKLDSTSSSAPHLTEPKANSLGELHEVMQAKKVALQNFIWKL